MPERVPEGSEEDAMDVIGRAAVSLAGLAFVALPGGAGAGAPRPVEPAALAFDLEDVRLLEGRFKDVQELHRRLLLDYEPGRLLHTFRLNAGLPTSAKPYGGWEAPGCGVRGHFTGHYLTACAIMHAATGDAELKRRGEHLVAELAKCQEALGGGYLSAFPTSIFGTLEEKGGGVWAPYYVIHKIMAGLLDTARHSGDRRALDMAARMSDYFAARMARLSPEKVEAALNTAGRGPKNEFGGIAEALMDLCRQTGDARHLELALVFMREAFVGPLAEERDVLTGLHANTHVPQATSFAQAHLATGDERLLKAAEFFWRDVTSRRSFAFGGNSFDEHFRRPGEEAAGLGPATAETCNTHNMLKLTRALFEIAPSCDYADYFENALYNHVLASIAPDTGMTAYFMSTLPGFFKTYCTREDSFWCCTATGVENAARFGEGIYFRKGDALWVNLYIPSVLTWKERGIVVRQETRFPAEDTIRFTVTAKRPAKATVNLRIPEWVAGAPVLTVNGRAWKVAAAPGSYAEVSRTWRSGDRIELRLPTGLRLRPSMDRPDVVSVFHGPVLLAGELGREGMPPSDEARGQKDLFGAPAADAPVLITEERDPGRWLEPVAGRPLAFRSAGVGEPTDVTLVPFYDLHHERYTVYWRLLAPGSEELRRLRAERQKRKAMEARILDAVVPGDAGSERDHGLKAEASNTGVHRGRRWRDGREYGYALRVDPERPISLGVTYWGNESGRREFDVFVDGTLVATENVSGKWRRSDFVDAEYPIPAELTKGKASVTVRFVARPGSIAGGVFGVRTLVGEPPGATSAAGGAE